MRTWPGGGEVPGALLGNDEELRGTARLAEMLPGSSEPAELRARAAINAAREYALGVACDRRQVSKLREAAVRRRLFLRWVPEFERDIHDLEALGRVIDALSDLPDEDPHA